MDEPQQLSIRGPEPAHRCADAGDVGTWRGDGGFSGYLGFVRQTIPELSTPPYASPMAVDELPCNSVKPGQVVRRTGQM
jgi:hypothetical protein